jgi:hypothetical protein
MGDIRASCAEKLFDEVAGELREVMRRTGLERTLAIGELVLRRFFQGSVSAWRERRNYKNNSVRRLAERPDCPLSRSALNRSIAIYELTQRAPSVLKLHQVGAGHLGVVLPLPASEQERWLQRANDERWGVRQLKAAIQVHRHSTGEKRGRRPAPPLERALSATDALLKRLEANVAALARVAPEAFASARLGSLCERLSALSDQITQLRLTQRHSRHDSGVWPATRAQTAPTEEALPAERAKAAS